MNKENAILNALALGGARPVGIVADVDAKARKTGNPFGSVSKRVRVVGFVGADYQSAVKNEAARQGTDGKAFKAESLPWGEWVPGFENRVIRHNGKLYLRTQSTPGQRNRQPARVLAYRGEDGRFLSRDDIKPFLPRERESAKQQATAGLSRTVHVRTYSFEGIRALRIGGKTLRFS